VVAGSVSCRCWPTVRGQCVWLVLIAPHREMPASITADRSKAQSNGEPLEEKPVVQQRF